MRVVILGRSGQLARCLAETSPMPIVCLGRSELDLSCPDNDITALRAHRPELVINAAAYTTVDQAEQEPEAAFALNAHAPGRIAAFCREHRLPLLHVSTDYVFDGTAAHPYHETDEPAPLNTYGQSKLEGERAVALQAARHMIIRTSWLYSAYGKNFVTAMLRLGRQRRELRVVADQIGRPTSAHQLARVIWRVVEHLRKRRSDFPWGMYHYADNGHLSWADFAASIFAMSGLSTSEAPRIERIATEQFPTAAPRPRYSVLDTSKFERVFQVSPQPWKVSLNEVLGRLGKEAAV